MEEKKLDAQLKRLMLAGNDFTILLADMKSDGPLKPYELGQLKAIRNVMVDVYAELAPPSILTPKKPMPRQDLIDYLNQDRKVIGFEVREKNLPMLLKGPELPIII
jgi:hypothetical protein